MHANLTHLWTTFTDDVESAYDEEENHTHTFLYFTYIIDMHNIRIARAWVVAENPQTAISSVPALINAIITINFRTKQQKTPEKS